MSTESSVMAYVKIQSVLKGFHATHAVLIVGQCYGMRRVFSSHDNNAFYIMDGIQVRASMEKELNVVIAPLWDARNIRKIDW
jgi:hypothetical protein